MHRGFIKLWRCIEYNPMWLHEPFTRSQAWIDLILIANHKPSVIRRRGIKVNVSRGEVGYSLRSLSERWRWSLGKVQRFIDELKNESQIDTRIDTENINVTSLIVITNYETYQCNDTENGTITDTETIRKRVQNKNVKNEKNTETKFTAPKPEEVKEYMTEIGYNGDAQYFVDYYEARGWMLKAGKMKCWKATVRTWKKHDKTQTVSTPRGGLF